MNLLLINNSISDLINKGIVKPQIGKAVKAVPTEIKEVNEHALVHGITREQAQEYINTAEVMFDQPSRAGSADQKYMYLSRDGSATVVIEKGRLISAYGKNDFTAGTKAIMEVIRHAGNL